MRVLGAAGRATARVLAAAAAVAGGTVPTLHMHPVRRGSERLDNFKYQMNWNQEELEQWASAQKQKVRMIRAFAWWIWGSAMIASSRRHFVRVE